MRSSSREVEVEAKFLLQDPSLPTALSRLRRVGPFRLVRRGRERQRNLYWDTEDLCLKRARAALKLRQVGPRAEVTFKRELRYRGGVSHRIEVTVPVRRSRLRKLWATRHPIGPIRRAREIAGVRPLKEVLTLWTDRRRRVFGLGRERIELDLDRVTVRQGKRPIATHREVELENRSASADRFQEALQALRRRFGKGLKPCRRSKYELGLAGSRGPA